LFILLKTNGYLVVEFEYFVTEAAFSYPDKLGGKSCS
jgi:hypothetical protein